MIIQLFMKHCSNEYTTYSSTKALSVMYSAWSEAWFLKRPLKSITHLPLRSMLW